MRIRLYIGLDSLNDLEETMKYYDCIKVYRSITTVTGAYTEITTVATRIKLQGGILLYDYYDENGELTYWYRTSFFNSKTSLESEQSDPHLGDDSITLDHIMTVSNLKDIYLTGIDLTDDEGNEFPDIMFEFAIRKAIDLIEYHLDIYVRPFAIVDERHDYDQLLMEEWCIIQLDEYPVISIDDNVKLFWPSSDTPYEFPREWESLQAASGQLNLVPTAGTLAQAMTIGGSFTVIALQRFPWIPNALSIDYTAGYAIGTLPYSIRDLIGKMAAIVIFHPAGDLIIGAGIASSSISIDGLSQSIGTTQSAMYSGYSARINDYEKELKREIPVIRSHIKNVGLQVA